MKIDVGLKMKEYRKKNGFTQVELAKKAGISRSHLNDIENKRKNLTMKTLENITKKMGVSLCEFLCDTEAKRGIRLFEVHLADEVVELEADSINYHDDHITLYDKDRNLVAYFNKTFVEYVIKKS